jgi:hypothetical protein
VRLLKSCGCDTEDFYKIALDQGWIAEGDTWPLPEQTLAQFIDPENWSVAILPELQALKK